MRRDSRSWRATALLATALCLLVLACRGSEPAARSADARIVAGTIAALDDPFHQVHVRALRELSVLGEEVGQEVLGEQIDDDGYERIRSLLVQSQHANVSTAAMAAYRAMGLPKEIRLDLDQLKRQYLQPDSETASAQMLGEVIQVLAAAGRTQDLGIFYRQAEDVRRTPAERAAALDALRSIVQRPRRTVPRRAISLRRLAALIDSGEAAVCRAACRVLAATGDIGTELLPSLMRRLAEQDISYHRRLALIDVVAALGPLYAKQFTAAEKQLLIGLMRTDPAPAVRQAAFGAAAAIGLLQRELLIELLANDPDLRPGALAELESGPLSEELEQTVVALLRNGSAPTQVAAIDLLAAKGRLHVNLDEVTAVLRRPLLDPDGEVRARALEALASEDDAARLYVPLILELLRHRDGDWPEPLAVAAGRAFFANEAVATRHLGELRQLILPDNLPAIRARALTLLAGDQNRLFAAYQDVARNLREGSDPQGLARAEAIRALANSGLLEPHMKALLAQLQSDGPARMPAAAAIAFLENLDQSRYETYRKTIFALLHRNDSELRLAARKIIAQRLCSQAEDILLLLAPLYGASHGSELAEQRYLAHRCGGGKRWARQLLSLLQTTSAAETLGSAKEQRQALRLLAENLTFASSPEGAGLTTAARRDAEQTLRNEMAGDMVDLAKALPLKAQDQAVLQQAQTALAAFAGYSSEAEQIAAVQAKIQRPLLPRIQATFSRWLAALAQHWKMLSAVLAMVAAAVPVLYLGLVLLLAAAWPANPLVDQLLNWGPAKGLRLSSFVLFLLTRLQLFRIFDTKMLGTFDQELLKDMGHFDQGRFFADLESSGPKGRTALAEAMHGTSGPMLLTGGSCAGKTEVLRSLAHTSGRPAVFLSATSVRRGVAEAVQERVTGLARELRLLEYLIQTGRLEVYIDGLEQLTSEEGEQLASFLRRMSQGRIVATCHVDSAERFPGPTVLRLETLGADTATAFLHHIGPGTDEYLQRCEAQMKSVAKQLSAGNKEWQSLLNPCDLYDLSELIKADGGEIDWRQVLDRQLERTAATWFDRTQHDFPKAYLCTLVHKMSEDGLLVIPPAGFESELEHLERHRITLGRWRNGDRRWFFRHGLFPRRLLEKENPWCTAPAAEPAQTLGTESSPPRSQRDPERVARLRDELAYLQGEEAISSSPKQKEEMGQRVHELKQRIAQLETQLEVEVETDGSKRQDAESTDSVPKDSRPKDSKL